MRVLLRNRGCLSRSCRFYSSASSSTSAAASSAVRNDLDDFFSRESSGAFRDRVEPREGDHSSPGRRRSDVNRQRRRNNERGPSYEAERAAIRDAENLETLVSRGVAVSPAKYAAVIECLVDFGFIEQALDTLNLAERDPSLERAEQSAFGASELEEDAGSSFKQRQANVVLPYLPLLRHFVWDGDTESVSRILARMDERNITAVDLIMQREDSAAASPSLPSVIDVLREDSYDDFQTALGRSEDFGSISLSRGTRDPLPSGEPTSASSSADTPRVRLPSDISVDPVPLIKMSISPTLAHAKALESRQRANETRATEDAERRYRKMLDEITRIGRGADCSPAEKMLVGWFHPLVQEIRTIQKDLRGGKPATSKFLSSGSRFEMNAEYFLSLPPEKLAVLAMHTLLGQVLAQPQVANSQASRSIGAAVQAEVGLAQMRKSDRRVHDRLRKQRPSYYKVNIAVKHALNREGDAEAEVAALGDAASFSAGYKNEGDAPADSRVEQSVGSPAAGSTPPPIVTREIVASGMWPPKAARWLGNALVTILLDVATVQLEDGAQARAFVKNFNEISAHPRLLEAIQHGHKLRETLHARHLPMICPPRDWTSSREGGLLSLDTPVVRIKAGSAEQQEMLLQADMDDVYRSLDILGGTAWKINEEVHAIVQEAWLAGGGIGDLPPQVDVAVPPEPLVDPDLPGNDRIWRRYWGVKKKVERHNMDLHGLRCNLFLQLEVAREFLDERLYFPHNMDFRGRTYPIPPHLNHLGSDLCRGLLTFHDGEPLGERGLHWLKIHLANVFGNGVDKRSFDSRSHFAVEHQAQIYDSADKPLTGNRWWLQAESPWQCLATCFELARAWRHSAQTKDWNASDYVCRLPIHQDGTCNGLQHYAALGGDVDGARSVNLLDADLPQDVYSEILSLVRIKVDADAANSSSPDYRVARLLEGRLVRKIIKQTVMTSVYGVTFIGARKQIANAMKDRQLVPPEEYNEASMYVARKTFECLAEMFGAAREIQEWLGDCAVLIARENQPVRWTTPLGLPVVQPYRSERGSRHFVETLSHRMALVQANERSVNRQRQKSAFPPNYVHSLDSSHMMKTALGCNEAGLTFASVHDSFWTHARDVDKMGSILRDAFVDLHDQDLLGQLLDQFQRQHPRITFPPIPTRGDFDVKDVTKSSYFFN